MAGQKGIFDNQRRALPDRAYVSLTEAVTWIVASDSRDDRYITDKIGRHATQMRKQWDSINGPAWLIPHLERLIEGREWEFAPDYPGLMRDAVVRHFEQVKSWLTRQKWTPREALDEVTRFLARNKVSGVDYERCHDLIWNACAREEIQLLGLQRNQQTGMVASEHKPVPFTFFLRPVFHWMGTGPNGLGELALSHKPHGRSYTQFRTDQGSRASYLEVQIRRDDVLMLEKRFREITTCAKRQRGRPPAYDWAAFHAETLRVLDVEGEPGLDPEWNSLADLERLMAEWCERAWGRTPVPSTIRRRVHHALKQFRQKREAEN